ncbi:tRNA (N(6)-L-threonylcarbamoyladenosine(37)-C(2))-methylthiotransferase MtaB [Leucothrix mucor]|uniref:tRNA (N(6)-L-threonylcarbamoyladenosine(37)-C(2))- methylthiotransferase MtaB n=1 Tax=Leucothrix mucor TaxID=45248 RepID=UPI0003B6E7DC|nr:tRNA (N(6)-L-threonylcarbamoyladenosine(37)-C(2))-methylthiotransferase MtaB [Leucothrix mucor]
MKVHLKALGCRLNEAELEQWSHAFRAEGHSMVTDHQDADVVVVNTCAVTADAGKKSRKLMNRLYRENPESKLVVSGCYATLEADKVADHLGVDLVVPNPQKDQLPQMVMDKFEANTMPLIAMEPGESNLFQRGRQRAFIKIQDGCRYRCTFCIVTVARGDERSRTIADILDEVQRLQTQGINEIVLTGVHVGGYGSDLDTSLFDLVKAILSETDIQRIRFASVEPWDLPDEFFGLFEDPRLMPHMHLPLQSGSDTVLRRMSRRCKTDSFRHLVEQARQSVPGFNVTSDIIVGFPGETEAEWQQTMEYVESVGFGHLHIFSYSPREGTKASRLPNPVDELIKKERSLEMHALAERLKQDFAMQHVGQTVPVLWERQKLQGTTAIYAGYTPNFMKVETSVTNAVLLENRIVNTQLIGYDEQNQTLTGKVG